jgi:predicted 3-demethylubiquinone-9 3-methyltransferase (glyoxalase superfamily)
MKTKEASSSTMNPKISGEKGQQQKIAPCLWFDDQAEEAVNFYTSLFENSTVGRVSRYGEEGREITGKEPGSVMAMDFQLEGFRFTALNGGPYFKFTPAISFFINCEKTEEVDKLWGKLADGGTALMPLDKYPFSEKYGWIQDKYGVSWQVNLAKGVSRIVPSLLFVGDKNGKAEEAVHFYTSLFKSSEIGVLSRYGKGEGGTEGTLNYASFTLNGQEFAAMDSSLDHQFNFSEAVSLMVDCKTQEETDYFWDKLSEGGDPNAQQCGWLKDKYGVSWQVVPTILVELLTDPDFEKSQRVMKAMLQMKKIDIAGLKKAYKG